ncbi:MAG: MgtC/SapB family protein [Treponema sp.]|nr:MgtC/SapB family protein [Treponema sp.]
MDFFHNLFNDHFVLECCFKLFLSAVFGIILGVERRNHMHAIGIRTMLLISASCALLGILSYYGAENPASAMGDPTRIAAGVVTGIGFLGGGVIMHQGFNIKGITTAAIIWTAAALGLSVGYGLYLPSLLVFLLVILSLPLFKKIEKMYFPASRIKTVNLVYSDDNADIEAVKKALASCGILLRDINYSTDFADDKFKVEIIVNTPANVDFAALGKKLKKTGALAKFSFQ